MPPNKKNLTDVPLGIPLRSRMLIPYVFSEMDWTIYFCFKPACKKLKYKRRLRCLSLFRSRICTPALFLCSRLRHGHSFLSHFLTYGLLRSRFYKGFVFTSGAAMYRIWNVVFCLYTIPRSRFSKMVIPCAVR